MDDSLVGVMKTANWQGVKYQQIVLVSITFCSLLFVRYFVLVYFTSNFAGKVVLLGPNKIERIAVRLCRLTFR
jgi:hypothetical protein